MPHWLRAVVTRGDDEPAVGRERYGADRLSDLSEMVDLRAAGNRPERDIAGGSACEETRRGRIEGQVADAGPANHGRENPLGMRSDAATRVRSGQEWQKRGLIA